MSWVQIKTPQGPGYVNTDNVVFVGPAVDQAGHVVVNACMMHMIGGSIIGLPLTPEAMMDAIRGKKTAAAGPDLRLNGEAE